MAEEEENEINIESKLNELSDEEKENIFVIKTRSQLSSELPNWKQKMIEKNGEDATFFLCLKDKIYFCTSYKDCISYPVYTGKCPICKRNRCFYCKRWPSDLKFHGDCCIKRRIINMIYKDGQKYISPIGNDAKYPPNFKYAFIMFLIPFLSLLFFIYNIQISFFYDMTMASDYYDENEQEKKIYQMTSNMRGVKNAYMNSTLIMHSSYSDYRGYLRIAWRNFYPIIFTLNVLMVLLYLIPYSVFYLICKLILLLISVPSCFYPLKFCLGVAFYKD